MNQEYRKHQKEKYLLTNIWALLYWSHPNGTATTGTPFVAAS